MYTFFCVVHASRSKDTIINFGEDLPKAALKGGFAAAKRADLCLAMGSSLTVTPAADIPQEVADSETCVGALRGRRGPPVGVGG
jgi:NAD-dependent SIR2 family protein deacetylase